jgi:hypothetical protein
LEAGASIVLVHDSDLRGELRVATVLDKPSCSIVARMLDLRDISTSNGCAGVDDVEVDGDGGSSSSVGGGGCLELELLGNEIGLHLGKGHIIDVRAASTSDSRVVVGNKGLHSEDAREESKGSGAEHREDVGDLGGMGWRRRGLQETC